MRRWASGLLIAGVTWRPCCSWMSRRSNCWIRRSRYWRPGVCDDGGGLLAAGCCTGQGRASNRDAL